MTGARYHEHHAWEVGLDVPEPTCLGDLLKLIGQPLKSEDLIGGHVASSAKLSLPSHQLGFSCVLKIIEGNAGRFEII